MIVLVVLRHDQRLADMAGGNDISATTIRRRHDELTHLLAAKTPRLDRALKKIARRAGEVVLIDGTPIPTQRRTARTTPASPPRPARPRADRRARPSGVDIGRPARPHPRHHRPARHDLILAHLRAAGLGALADLGFLGRDDDGDDPVVVTGFKATRVRRLASAEKEASRVLAAGRVPVERGFAHRKNWRILTKLRTDPARATHLFGALLVLTNIEATTGNWSLPQVAHDQHMPTEQRHRAGIG
ncbi:transposase family protein [Streptomyces sp. NPDC002676]